MAWTMDDMMSKITGYRDIMERHGFKHTGDGYKAWSRRHTNEAGTLHVDVRASEWTLYTADNKEIASSHIMDDLDCRLAMMAQLQ